ncbi:MAG: hypothetical protein WCJ14_11690 [Verrucomicrobiota bacterium]
MKANPSVLLAGLVLWIATLAGAYQLGHLPPAQASANAPAATANLRLSSSTRAGTDGTSRDHTRAPDKQMTVKQVFAQLKATMRPGSMQNPMVMMRAMALLDKLRPEDLPEALAEAEAMKDPQGKMMVYMAVMGKWAEQDGAAAMKYAEEHAKDLGTTGAIMKMSVAAAWAESDPNAVWEWYKSNKDNDSGGMLGGNQMVLMSVFSSLMANDPDTAFKRLDELDPQARTMALAGMTQSALFDDTKRQALLSRIDAMPDGAERTQARQMLLSQWAMLAPDEATAWIGQQPAAEQKELRDSMGAVLMMTDPKKGAAFMLEGAAAEDKPKIYSSVMSTWARTSPDAASAWLAGQGNGPEMDQGRLALVNAISDKNPSGAMNHTLEITDANLRFTAANTVYQKWQAKDAAAANQALDKAGLTAEQVQQIRSSQQTTPRQ